MSVYHGRHSFGKAPKEAENMEQRYVSIRIKNRWVRCRVVELTPSVILVRGKNGEYYVNAKWLEK